ncbi:hypothetical protein VNO78_24998 [Psophocarpus tetragonolobus]|uniref:Uncharacterized protein n=1 Tax=Psophocarpus tetragonolobus TaxID=3891 RepID=A0AAN9S6I4_PSOTE
MNQHTAVTLNHCPCPVFRVSSSLSIPKSNPSLFIFNCSLITTLTTRERERERCGLQKVRDRRRIQIMFNNSLP